MSGAYPSILRPLTTSCWWEETSDRFIEALRAFASKRIRVLYHADADGFCSSVFVHKVLRHLNPNLDRCQIQSRAVWNFEYDFQWVSDWIARERGEAVIGLDLPLAENQEMLDKICRDHKAAIYDHHVIAPRSVPNRPGSLYLNWQMFEPDGVNHPACAFAAGVMERLGGLSESDEILLGAGLLGDRALDNYPDLLRKVCSIAGEFPERGPSPSFWKGRINARFRACPGETPLQAEQSLIQYLDHYAPWKAFELFSDEYQLEESSEAVTEEVGRIVGMLERSPWKRVDSCVYWRLVNLETFSGGIIASIFAERKVAPIVAIGTTWEGRVQVELRTAPNANINLGELLQSQKDRFSPLASGGHPEAAGALLKRGQEKHFIESLREIVREDLSS